MRTPYSLIYSTHNGDDTPKKKRYLNPFELRTKDIND